MQKQNLRERIHLSNRIIKYVQNILNTLNDDEISVKLKHHFNLLISSTNFNEQIKQITSIGMRVS